MNRSDSWVEGGLLAAAGIFLIFLVMGLSDLLNPFLLYLALVGVLVPLRAHRFFWPIVGTAGALTAFWLLSEMGFLLAPFVLAVVGAYILNPVVRWLAQHRPLNRLAGDDGEGRGARTASIGLLALPVLGGTVALAIWGIPWMAQEAAALSRRAPEVLNRLAGLIESAEGVLARLQFPGVDGSEWAARLQELDGDALIEFLDERRERIGNTILTGVLGLGRGVGSVLTILGYLVLTPVLTFYLLRDWDRVLYQASGLVPEARTDLRSFAKEFDEGLSAYLRGQLLVSVTIGTLTAVGLLIVQFPFAIFLGAVVAVFNIVPYLGLVLSLVPALGIALATGSPGTSLLKVAIVYGIAQGLEGSVIGPKIVGDSTGLHPVWVLLSIMVGGFFFGFVGLLIAVPVAVGLKLLVVRGVRRYRNSELFAD